MPFATVFTCDNVEFTTALRVAASGNQDSDNWHSVKISVQEMGLTNRWVYVELKGNTRPVLPIVHMALSDGWDVSCDERTMTLVMHGQDAQTRAGVTQKLRFENAMDFWSFMYQVALSRVREYSARQRRVYPYVAAVSEGY